MADESSSMLAVAGQEQFLTFLVGTEEFGVDILGVQEIRGWSGATPLPHTPAHMLGVINLRGSVIPVIDLRRRFGTPSAEFGASTVVIVVRRATAAGGRIAAFVVDAVCEVRDVAPKDRKPLPEGLVAHQGAVSGLATVGDKTIILLDIEQLFAATDAVQHGARAA
jgi:purine-binding chemotaxis protein CheW